MSGFLTRLLARSFGHVEAIGPRAAFLFEPVATQKAPMAPAWLSAAAEVGESAASDVRPIVLGERHDELGEIHTETATAVQGGDPAVTATEQVKASQQDAVSERDSLVANPPPPTPHDISPGIGRQPAGIEERIVHGPALRPPQSSPAGHQPGVAATVFAQAQSLREEIDPSAWTPLPGDVSIATATRISADGGQNAVAAGDGNRNEPLPIRSSHKPSLPAPKDGPIRAPASPPSIGAPERAWLGPRFDRGAPPGLRRSAEPEPTIQVTIGRIEVRAELSASPPAKERPAPKPMSLDDYLRRQAGRGR
jgi:hypothetical protein